VVIKFLGGVCAFCHSTTRLEVDHIIPLSRGGTDDPSNLQVLCQRCHRVKHGNRHYTLEGIPSIATIRTLYINCGRCPKKHGPYFYSEWRERGKVRTKYLGKFRPFMSKNLRGGRSLSSQDTPSRLLDPSSRPSNRGTGPPEEENLRLA
jgi:hypothetical protein